MQTFKGDGVNYRRPPKRVWDYISVVCFCRQDLAHMTRKDIQAKIKPFYKAIVTNLPKHRLPNASHTHFTNRVAIATLIRKQLSIAFLLTSYSPRRVTIPAIVEITYNPDRTSTASRVLPA